MFMPKLGASLITLADEVTDAVIEAVARSGIATLEVAARLLDGDDGQQKASALKAMSARTGIRIASVHARFGEPYDFSVLEEDARAMAVQSAAAAIDLARGLGAPIVVYHASAEPVNSQDRPARLQRAREAISELSGRCSEGIGLAVELLPRTCLGNTVDELLELIGPPGSAAVGVCLDTNHLMDRHADLPDDARRLGARLIALHLSDYDGTDEKHWLPGEGCIDWTAFMAALRDIDYAGPFNYECKLPASPLSQRIRLLETNFNWLSRL